MCLATASPITTAAVIATTVTSKSYHFTDILAMAGGARAELQLLGAWASPFVMRVKLVLGMKGLSYEYVEQDLENKSQLLLESNPVYKKVPVLIHKGKPVCESLVIVQYLDDVWAGTGPSILPADPYERATARFWAAYIEDKFFPSWMAIFKSKTEEERTEAFKNTIPHLETLEEAFKKCSKGKGFFAGDAIGYADVTLGCYVGWIKAVDEVAGIKLLDEAKFPLLTAWAERFSAADAVKEAVPDVEKIVEYYKILQAKWNAAAAIN